MISQYGSPQQRVQTFQQNNPYANVRDPYHVPGYIPPNTQGGYNGPVYGSAAGTYLPYSNKATYDPYQELGAAAENPDYYTATGGALQPGNSVRPGGQQQLPGSSGGGGAGISQLPSMPAGGGNSGSSGGNSGSSSKKSKNAGSSSGSSFAPSSVPNGYDPNILGAQWNPAPGGGYAQRSNGAVITSAGDGGSFDAYNPGRFRGQGNVDPRSGASAGSGYSGFGQDKYVGSEQFYSSDAIAYRTGSGTSMQDRTFNMEGRAPGKHINEELSYRGTSPDAYNGGGGDRAAGRNEWGYMDENDSSTHQRGSSPGYRQAYGRYAAQPAGGSSGGGHGHQVAQHRKPTGQRMAGEALRGLGV